MLRVLCGGLVLSCACSTHSAETTLDGEVPNDAHSEGSVPCPTSETGVFPMSDLPQGKPCISTSGVCSLAVEGMCGDAIASGIVNGWECGCENDAWKCVITSPGGGSCGPNLGTYCGDTPPRYGLSGTCFSCCEPGEGCFLSSCPDYDGCYCDCDPKDAGCIARCAPQVTATKNPGCASCFKELANCMAGKCASMCAGESVPDPGGVADAGMDGGGK
jgi:hypothetical protein